MAIEYSAINLTSAKGFAFAINEDLTLYVATDGSDELNTGLTLNSPFATPHKALTYLGDKFISGNAIVTIQCAAGKYTFDKNLVVTHPNSDRIAIVGADPVELTLKQVDAYIDTTGYTGDKVEGLENEGGAITYNRGVVRTGVQVALGKTGEDISYNPSDGTYDSTDSSDGNAHGERFSMICTVSGATADLTTDTYVLVRGFSGGYESVDNSITGTTVDSNTYYAQEYYGTNTAHHRMPALNIANEGRNDLATPKKNYGDGHAFFRASTDTPSDRKHTLRYPYWREPENMIQRFYAIGCHKVLGIGVNTKGLHLNEDTNETDGITGSHLARVTLENKNTNRNLFGIDEYGFSRAYNPDETETHNFAVNDDEYDYDLPRPTTKSNPISGTDPDSENQLLVTNDRTGYDPQGTQGTRASVGTEDSAIVGTHSETHGVFTMSGVRTVFEFSNACKFDVSKTDQTKGAVVIDTPGLYRLDNVIIRPETDLATAPSNEWGAKIGDVTDEDGNENYREFYRGIDVRPDAHVKILGPNIGITDFTGIAVVNHGQIRASGPIVQNSKRGVYTAPAGDTVLQNTIVSSCPEENIRAEGGRTAVHRSIILGSGKHMWARNGATMTIVDCASLYGMQYYKSTTPPSNNGEIQWTRNSTGEINKLFVHRSGNAIETRMNSAVSMRYVVHQEGWTRSFIAKNQSSIDAQWCASIRPREDAFLSWNKSFMHLGNILISGCNYICTFDHNQDAGTSTTGNKAIQLSGSASTFTNNPLVVYNGYGGYGVFLSHDVYIENEDTDNSNTRWWFWGNYGQYGEGEGDGYGSGDPTTLWNGGGTYNDSHPVCGTRTGQVQINKSLSRDPHYEGYWDGDSSNSTIIDDWTSGRPTITFT